MATKLKEIEKERKKERREIAPWRPFTDMMRWERDMERMFDDFMSRRIRPFRDEWLWPSRALGVSAPALDLFEEKDEIVAKVELPGMTREDIEVNISDGQLTIKGEKKKAEEVEEKDYYRSERIYGAFSRTVELPKGIEVEKVQASFKNGVLEIRLPKSEEAKKKEIPVKVE